MRKKFILKKAKKHSMDKILIDDEPSTEIKTNIGVINVNENQLGVKSNKQRFNNNPNKVFMKRGKNNRKK